MKALNMTFRVAILTVLFLLGCAPGRYWMSDPEKDRVIRVECGDRHYLTLQEDSRNGYHWTATSDDKDAEISIAHEDGKAKVRIRIHRGFDGPATIVFELRRPGESEAKKTFTISCYRRTGDSAFWKE